MFLGLELEFEGANVGPLDPPRREIGELAPLDIPAVGGSPLADERLPAAEKDDAAVSS